MHGPLRAGIQEALDTEDQLDEKIENEKSELQDVSNHKRQTESEVKLWQQRIAHAQAVIDSFPAKIRRRLEEPESAEVIRALGYLEAKAEAFQLT